MSRNIIDLIIIFGIMQGVVFALAIIFSKFFRSKANVFLGISILLIVFINVQSLCLKFSIYSDYPKFRLFEDIELVLLFPAMLYFYYKSSLNFSYKFDKKDLLIFLPFIISLIANFYVGGYVYFDWYLINNKSWISTFFTIEFYFTFLFNLALLIIEFFIIYKRKTTNNQLIEDNLKWLKLFYLFHVILTLVWISVSTVEKLTNKDLADIFWVLINLLFYWIGYTGIFKFSLAKNRYEIRKIVENKKRDKPLKKAISTNQDSTNLYFTKMIHLFEEEKIHHDPNLSRTYIAEKLSISTGYLSQIVSEQSEKKIPDYLNYYRVEDAKKMILDPDFNQYSLLAIGFEAGFNSKTAFYTVFKKETGITPSAYRKQFKIN